MSLFTRLNLIRRLLPDKHPQEQHERLLRLYWNRAEIKKELTRLQAERGELLERLRVQEIAATRALEQTRMLEEYLGRPEAALHALVYFQLRALWRQASSRLARFAQQLQRQQSDRERHLAQIEFDQERCRQLADFERRIHDARALAGMLEAQLKLMDASLGRMRGFWNYFRRRQLLAQLAGERARWDAALMELTDLCDDRAALEARAPPDLDGISIDGRRSVNAAVIAYAQQLTALLSRHGLAMLAKETATKRLLEVNYGGPQQCAQIMTQLREAFTRLAEDGEELAGLKERIEALRTGANYRSDADTIPLTDSIGTPPSSASPVSELETVNVLVDDYWDLYRSLL